LPSPGRRCCMAGRKRGVHGELTAHLEQPDAPQVDEEELQPEHEEPDGGGEAHHPVHLQQREAGRGRGQEREQEWVWGGKAAAEHRRRLEWCTPRAPSAVRKG
jgi:hypothetical protein